MDEQSTSRVDEAIAAQLSRGERVSYRGTRRALNALGYAELPAANLRGYLVAQDHLTVSEN